MFEHSLDCMMGDGWHSNGEPGNYLTALEEYLQKWAAIPGADVRHQLSLSMD